MDSQRITLDKQETMRRLIRNSSIAILLAATVVAAWPVSAQAPPGPDTSKPVEQSTAPEKSKPALPGAAPNGKKLILKNGEFQLVREYQKNGERVRYYSLERADWEEIPSSMIDWAATQKAEAATAAQDRSEEHTSELQSPYVISYAVFC